MSSIDFIQDKEVILAALERVIVLKGRQVTNIEFAIHLFLCARDMLPFEDALRLYGYSQDDFSSELVSVFQTCYNIGNSHVKRELTARMMQDEKERASTLDLLDRLFGLYVKSEDGGNVTVNVNVTPSKDTYEQSFTEEAVPVITENDVPDA